MVLEDIVNKSKQTIQFRGAKTTVEKGRVIEHVISHVFQSIVSWEDEDFYSSCNKNLIQALREKRGSCCHFAVLTQYLHLRNNMYSDIICSKVDTKSNTGEDINHIFNLLFLEDTDGNWTFVDTMWEKEYIKLRDTNRFSFVSLEELQSDPSDVDQAHTHILKDLSSVSTTKIDMTDIDRKLGYQNKLYLYQYSSFIAYHIANSSVEKVSELFSPENEIMQNMNNKNQMIQFIGLVAYLSAVELGNCISKRNKLTPDESVAIQCLDTYLEVILPDLYAIFWENRIKLMKPDAFKDPDSLNQYAASLFQIIIKEDGSIGICFNDKIDSAYIGVGFTNENIPIISIFNQINFEKNFGKINTSELVEKADIEH